jgi:hypothetical protein
VFVLVDAKGNDVTGARLFVDDGKPAEPLDGHAIVLDPGTHKVIIETSGGASIEQSVVAREGEKNRRVRVQLPAPVQAPAESEATPQARKRRGSPSPLVWALSGVAVAGLGSFAYFGLTGKHQEKDLFARCAPRCGADEVDAMYRSYLVADISLGVSVAAASAAAFLFLSGPSGSSQAATAEVPLNVRVGSRGVALTYGGTF